MIEIPVVTSTSERKIAVRSREMRDLLLSSLQADVSVHLWGAIERTLAGAQTVRDPPETLAEFMDNDVRDTLCVNRFDVPESEASALVPELDKLVSSLSGHEVPKLALTVAEVRGTLKERNYVIRGHNPDTGWGRSQTGTTRLNRAVLTLDLINPSPCVTYWRLWASFSVRQQGTNYNFALPVRNTNEFIAAIVKAETVLRQYSMQY